MSSRAGRSIATLLLFACSAKQPSAARTAPQTAPTPSFAVAVVPAETVAVDSPRITAGGTKFIVPARWTLRCDDTRRVLEGPEKDIRVAIVDVNASSADDAVRRAWPALDPGFIRRVPDQATLPARNGWQSVRTYNYETSPTEKRVLLAVARRSDKIWCVLVLDGSDVARARRSAQVSLIMDSLRPAGFTRESFAGKTAHPLDARRLALLTGFIEKALLAKRVPGVAMSLIQGARVVFAGGFGVRELGKSEPVDADTLFFIASNTKALTTLFLAKEVDQGRFTWDTPVVGVYPPFRLADPAMTALMRMKHLVCACTGWPIRSLNPFWSLRETPADIVARSATLMPTSKFGEVFQYSNGMPAVAGYIGAHAIDHQRDLGAAYDEAMRREIFVPLGMMSTTFDFQRALAGNHASPHDENIDGSVAVVPPFNLNYMVIAARPSGGAWSSANDVTRYVQLELAKGRLPNGQRLLSEDAILSRRAQQVAMGEDSGYGMGLMVDRTSGVTLVHHGGAGVGFLSDMFWVPEAGVGGVILTNSKEGWRLCNSFMRRVLEVLYDGQPEAEEDVASAVPRHQVDVQRLRKTLTVPASAAAVAKLANLYRNPDIGRLKVIRRGPDTIFNFGEWQSTVASRLNADGTTTFLTIDPGSGRFEFLAGERDGKAILISRDGQRENVLVAE